MLTVYSHLNYQFREKGMHLFYNNHASPLLFWLIQGLPVYFIPLISPWSTIYRVYIKLWQLMAIWLLWKPMFYYIMYRLVLANIKYHTYKVRWSRHKIVFFCGTFYFSIFGLNTLWKVSIVCISYKLLGIGINIQFHASCPIIDLNV